MDKRKKLLYNIFYTLLFVQVCTILIYFVLSILLSSAHTEYAELLKEKISFYYLLVNVVYAGLDIILIIKL